jgi:hypothetical protein
MMDTLVSVEAEGNECYVDKLVAWTLRPCVNETIAVIDGHNHSHNLETNIAGKGIGEILACFLY